ncbi:cadherin repeat domain-containing protein [Fuerstiella marisgermanici]|uniref:Chitinase A n=1 Tax=Fuerstiella marisgermanici TaxID=1891926 RepID=A0A1P8W9Y9_9PLAN|nr:cadherin repeat domain-containing protein [Fuerstiella marisgermanici]APZ90860.1 Chitinase A precursor [Fuerstiella marisgermanici]
MKQAAKNNSAQVESFEPMILMSASAADVTGTDGDDVLVAYYNGQSADGLDGDDKLIGLGGDNVLHGGDGNDRFITISGTNVVDGGEGEDTLQFLNYDVSDFNIIDRGDGIIEISNAQQTTLVSNVEVVQFLDQLFLIDDLLNGSNNAPTIADPDSPYLQINENETFVVDVNADDLDGDTLTYAINGGADSALFQIDANTGELSFINAPDFENPLDHNGDNVYDVTVVVSDGQATVEKTLWVTVNDVNEGGGNNAPSFTNITEGQMIEVVENTIQVIDADAQDPDGDTLTYSFSDALGTPGSGVNEDTASFNIDPATGELTFINAPDFENPGDADGDNIYHVTLVVSDGNGGVQERNVVVKVLDENEGTNNAPYFTNVEEGEIVTVPENTTLVGDADGTDPDGDAVTYSIAGGADAALFTVDANTGVVSFINAPDFENPGDADGDNDYQITLRISDGSLSQDRNVVVRVTDRSDEGGFNRAPYFTNVEEGEIVTVPENTTLVGDADGTDPDGDAVTYSIAGGADAALFTVNAQTGVVSFINAPDFENPGDADGNNNYQITLRISDGSLSQNRDVTVRVTDRNDGGGSNNAPYFTNVEQNEVVTVPENTTLVGDADGTDPDGDAVTYSIVGGADAALFTVNAQTGVVSFINAPDFENPGDADGNNNYQITLRISDGSLSQDRDVTVRVTDRNDGGGSNNAPYFTNVEQNEVVTVPENTTLVGDADGTDPDGDAVTYSIVGGADAALFTVNAQTGVVSFINAPDFENPGDADGNNNYQITLRISDGSLSQDRDVTVRVTDRNDGGGTGGNNTPYFLNVQQGEVVWHRENELFVGDADAYDADGDQLTYSIVGGADASLFAIDSQSGRLYFINSPDFENPSDANGDNNYELTLRVSDGQSYQNRSVSVAVENVKEGGHGHHGGKKKGY